MENLISKYNISEQDAYKASFMISSFMEKKEQLGYIEKEKLRRKILSMLKPFKVSSNDLPQLINEIHLLKSHTDPKIIERYGQLNLDSYNYDSRMSILSKPILIGSGIGLVLLFIVFFLFSLDKKECGCRIPDVSIPSYADSWDDKKENWEYKECEMIMSSESAEKIHVYVFFNSKLDKYRCELKYSWPGKDCKGYSNSFGENAISTAEISKEDFSNGQWKKFDYWALRQLYPK